jgi:hypothetical protein
VIVNSNEKKSKKSSNEIMRKKKPRKGLPRKKQANLVCKLH